MIPFHDDNNIEVLIGTQPDLIKPLMPFDDQCCDFLADLSSILNVLPESKTYPEIMAFAFWCRKANITKIKSIYTDLDSRIGLGIVFHIAPSNVPINFAYSLVFGLLSGNANVVRVPFRLFPQVDVICSAINKVLANKKYQDIRNMISVIRYEYNDTITEDLSSNCDARVIWGGDDTIRKIRSFPIPVRGTDISFADRYSFCVIDSESIADLDQIKLIQLAEGFYNDTYLMDQNACSSPHLVVWAGHHKTETKKKFWDAVNDIVTKKYDLEAINSVDKYTLLCQNAIALEEISSLDRYKNYLYRQTIKELPANIDTFRGKCGYFFEYDANDINEISHIVNKKYQTLTYYGVDKQLLVDFVLKNRLLGIDRIVPIGKALDIGLIWDGIDVIRSLSRVVDVH